MINQFNTVDAQSLGKTTRNGSNANKAGLYITLTAIGKHLKPQGEVFTCGVRHSDRIIYELAQFTFQSGRLESKYLGRLLVVSFLIPKLII